MSDVVFLNGQFVESSDASVSVYDGGFLHGAGLFETMSARNGRIFRLDSHLNRLRRSAEELLVPLDDGALPSAKMFQELLDRNSKPMARVRLTVTAGSMQTPKQESTPPTPTVCVTVGDHALYGAEFYERGVKVVISQFKTSPSDPTAGHKTTGYLPRLLALREAQKVRCLEALWFTTQHNLAEGAISNVFILKKNVLKTPPLDTPVLPGIARGIVLEVATTLGLSCEECSLNIDELLDADEVFLTNAIMHVMPVVGVEKNTIGDGGVGPTAKRLLREYQRLIQKECK